MHELEALLASLRALNSKTAEELIEAKGQLEVKEEQAKQLDARVKDLMALLQHKESELAANSGEESRVQQLREKLQRSEQYYEGQLSVKDNVSQSEKIIKELRDRVNSLSVANPPNYDLEFYGTSQRGIGLADIEGRLSSIRKEEEEKLGSRLKSLEAANGELKKELEEKAEVLNRLIEKNGQLEGEVGVLRQFASGSTSEQRQQIQALLQKDEIIRSLEQKLAEANKALEGTKQFTSAERDRILSESMREKSTLEMQLKRLADAKNEEVSVKETMIKSLEEELEYLRAQKAETQVLKKIVKKGRGAEPRYIMAAPKVERLYKAAVEVRYEQDPYILAENEKLAKELEIALVGSAD